MAELGDGSVDGLRRRIRRRPLAAFLLCTFGVSWGVPGVALLVGPALGIPVSVSGYSPLAYVALWAPALAAFGVVWATAGTGGVSDYARRVMRPTGAVRWYAVVVLGVPLAYLVAAAISGEYVVPAGTGWLLPFAVASLLRLTQGPVEEIGWRGFALPMLQRRYPGWLAAATLGAIWALWHAPALLVQAAEFQREAGGALAFALLRLFATLIATSVVMTVVYNGSDGSVPLAVLFHWMTNLPYPWETGEAIPLAQDVVTVGVAFVVAATLGRRYLGRRNLVTRIRPSTDGRERPGPS